MENNINLDTIYIFNPDYDLKLDRNRVLLIGSKDNILTKVEVLGFVHPIHAILFSMFDGERNLKDVLAQDKKVKHADDSIAATDIHFLIEKHLHPEKGYKHYAINNAELKKKLIVILKKGGINLLNINDSSKNRIDSFEKYRRIYVIISKCTACELKRMIADFKMRQVLDTGNDLVIFPVFADQFQLLEIIKNEKIKFPLYLDCDDGFDLFSIIPNPKDNFIVIDNEDIKAPEVN